MSTILKALRRLERDKTRQVDRPLREQVAEDSEPGRRVPVLLMVLAVFALGIGMGAGALFLWPDRLGEPQPTESAAPPAQTQVQSVAAPPAPLRAPPAPTPVAAPPAVDLTRARPAGAPGPAAGALAPEPELPGEALASEVQVVRRIEPSALPIREVDAGAEPRAPRPGESRPGAQALKPRPRPARKPAPSQVAAAPSPAPRVERVPAPEPVAPPVYEPVPASETSRFEAAHSAVPVIQVSRTWWHPRAERREASIEVELEAGPEPRRVREGDSVGPLVVQRIDPSGVVFDYDGVELRHAVTGR